MAKRWQTRSLLLLEIGVSYQSDEKCTQRWIVSASAALVTGTVQAIMVKHPQN